MGYKSVQTQDSGRVWGSTGEEVKVRWKEGPGGESHRVHLGLRVRIKIVVTEELLGSGADSLWGLTVGPGEVCCPP